MPEYPENTVPRQVAAKRRAWALIGFVLGWLSFLLLIPVSLSYLLWGNSWIGQQEYVPG